MTLISHILRICFIQLTNIMDAAMSSALKQDICIHQEAIETAFDGYFKFEGMMFDAWVWNPFTMDLNSIDCSDLAKDDLT